MLRAMSEDQGTTSPNDADKAHTLKSPPQPNQPHGANEPRQPHHAHHPESPQPEQTVNPQSTAPLGLRERKRRETKLRIEDVATQLFLQHGYDNVTLEQICEGAHVSRRTFFNYFQSKDHVALGSTPPPISEGEAARIAELVVPAGSTLPHEVMALITERHVRYRQRLTQETLDAELSRAIVLRRHELLRHHPALGMSNLSNSERSRRVLIECISSNLARYPEHRQMPSTPIEEEAALITTAVFVTMWMPIVLPKNSSIEQPFSTAVANAVSNLTTVFSSIHPTALLHTAEAATTSATKPSTN